MKSLERSKRCHMSYVRDRKPGHYNMSGFARDHFLVATYEHMSLNATPTQIYRWKNPPLNLSNQRREF